METPREPLTSLPPDLIERGTLAGLFVDRRSAEAAIADLDANGFNLDTLGVALAERQEQRELINATGTQTVEEAAEGGSGILGTIANLLSPREPALAEKLVELLTGMGVPEAEARHFERGVAQGSTLVTVQALGVRVTDALAILNRHGADVGFAVSPEALLPSSSNPPDSTGLDLAGG
ncbi:general stress protein [Gloeobacter violaceus]|nr:general stress protein [Gloeobacter violaceus]